MTLISSPKQPLQRRALLAFASIGLTLLCAKAEAETKRYAVIVAENQSVDPGVQALRYADDDGATYYELFSGLADEVTLLSVLDADTQRQHRGLAAKTSPPTLENLRSALSHVNQLMTRERERGNTTIFYFVYAGHGDVGAGGEGYINLADVRFTRSDFFREILAPSSASYNHIIIDACKSYFLVNARGDKAPAWRDDKSPNDHADQVNRFLAEEDLSKYPNTGVLLSTSSAVETHEWEALHAGVFSYEVRSALTGAADVNSDGRIEYSELKAFIAAANAAVSDPKARLQVFAAAPASDLNVPLVDLSAARFKSQLLIPKTVHGHLYLEDDRGVRYADLNAEGTRSIFIALADAGYYYLRSATQETRIDLSVDGLHRAEGWKPIAIAARGNTDEEFQRGLFETPYGESFYQGFVVSSGDIPVSLAVTPWMTAPDESSALTDRRGLLPLPTQSLVAGALGVGAGFSAITFNALANDAKLNFQLRLEQTGVADPVLLQAIKARQISRDVFIGAAAVALGAGVTFYLKDRKDHLTLTPGAPGASAGLSVSVSHD